MNEKLRDEIMKKAVDRKIPCAAAQKIAEDCGITYAEVGLAANELGIKIIQCQLGCF